MERGAQCLLGWPGTPARYFVVAMVTAFEALLMCPASC